MRSVFFYILIVIAAFSTMAGNKEKTYPNVTLTLNDGTVIDGFLRSDLHNAGGKVSVSVNPDGKKMSYKISEINSLNVTDSDSENVMYIPIHIWDSYSKKVDKNPYLATICFKGNHVTGYRMPAQYIRSSAAVPSSNFQSYSWKYEAWFFCYKTDDNDIIKIFYTYIPVKKAPNLKSIIKDARKNFKEYPVVAENIENEGITAEEIIDNPCVMLEILDKSLK